MQLVAKRLNPGLSITALLPIEFVPGQVLSRDVVATLSCTFGDALLPSIRRSVRVGEAPHAHQPLTVYAPKDAVTTDFRAATKALLGPMTGPVQDPVPILVTGRNGPVPARAGHHAWLWRHGRNHWSASLALLVRFGFGLPSASSLI